MSFNFVFSLFFFLSIYSKPSLKNGIPRLINSLKISLPSKAVYLDVGLHPKNNNFNIRVVVVVGTTFLFLDDIEMALLFSYIRSHEDFRREVGGEEYYFDTTDATFLMNKYGRDYEILHLSRDETISATGFISYGDLKNLLFKEAFINNQIHRLRNEIGEFSEKLEELCRDVAPLIRHNPYIEQILNHHARTDGFAAEMLVNHMEFFSSSLNAYVEN